MADDIQRIGDEIADDDLFASAIEVKIIIIWPDIDRLLLNHWLSELFSSPYWWANLARGTAPLLNADLWINCNLFL